MRASPSKPAKPLRRDYEFSVYHTGRYGNRVVVVCTLCREAVEFDLSGVQPPADRKDVRKLRFRCLACGSRQCITGVIWRSQAPP